MLADDEYLDLLNAIDFQPVFIMGDARTGTTLLYHMLVQTGCFNYVSVYHILKEHELLTNRMHSLEEKARLEIDALFADAGLNTRGMDQVPVGTDLPEEYGFFLHRRTGPLWLTKKNLPVFIQFCKKVQFLSNSSRPLLLKSPLDYGKFMLLHSTFPGAKFIFNYRHPVNAINSQLRALQNNWRQGNAYLALLSPRLRWAYKSRLMRTLMRVMLSPRTPLQPMLRILIRRAAKTERPLLQSLYLLPKETYTSLRYEDLCAEPEATAHRLFQFLDLAPRERIDYRRVIERRADNLLPEVEQARFRICRLLKPIFERRGYKSD